MWTIAWAATANLGWEHLGRRDRVGPRAAHRGGLPPRGGGRAPPHLRSPRGHAQSALRLRAGFRLDLSTSVAVDIRIVVADVAGVHAAATLSFPFHVDPERNAEGGTDVFLGIGVGHPGFVLDYTSPAGSPSTWACASRTI